MKLPQRVTMIGAVSRDGLHNEQTPVPTEIRVGLIARSPVSRVARALDVGQPLAADAAMLDPA